VVETLPEVVAHHFTEAGLAKEAIGCWVKAGRRAHARLANREADKFFEQALHLLGQLPESRETLEQAIDLRFYLKRSLLPLGQFERIVDYLRDAEGLARRLGDQRRLSQFCFHMCQTLGLSGKPVEALAFGEQAVALAEPLGDVGLQVGANLYLGATYLWTGDYRRAELLFLEILRLLEGELSRERFGLTGYPAISAICYLIRINALQGKFKQGLVLGEEGIRLAEALEHPDSLASVLWFLGDLHVAEGRFNHAVGPLQRGLAVTRQWNLQFLSACNSGVMGHTYALLGRPAEGLPLLEQALGVFETMGHRFAQSLFLVPLGEACMFAGQLSDALKFAERALALARKTGQRSGEASALHLLGEVTTRCDHLEHAEGHYRHALALAEELGMRPLIAHCHHGLGKLCRRTGTREQAQEHVAKATAMYRDMDMPFWLEQAEMPGPH
jgi:tetratricopeptide (TPR) repeat protein